jgi:hypothetical protein
MEKFNWDEYQKNPGRKVITRNGRLVSGIKLRDMPTMYPLCGYVEYVPGLRTWKINGVYDRHEEWGSWDLFFADKLVLEPNQDTQENCCCISFSESNYLKLRAGKTTTIRRADEKTYQLGPVTLSCPDLGQSIESEVTEIRIVRFGDLGLADAVSDGFNSVEDLRVELQNCYRKLISDFEVVLIIRFKRVNG